MKYCTKCGTANYNEANYCIQDGYPLHNVNELPNLKAKKHLECFYCGTERHLDASYCHLCGLSFESPEAQKVIIKDEVAQFNPLNRSFIKRSILRNFVIAFVSLFVLLIGNYLIINGEKERSHRPLDYEQSHLLLTYEYGLGDFVDFRRYATTWTVDNPDSYEQPFSPFEMMLLSNLSVINYEEFYRYGNNESSTVQVRNLGLVFYLFLSLVSISLAIFIFKKWLMSSNLSQLLFNAGAFSFWYCILLVMIGIMVSEVINQSVRDVMITYPIMDIIWKSILISFSSSLIVLLIINKVKLPQYFISVVYGTRSYVYLLIGFIIVGLIVYNNMSSSFEFMNSNLPFMNSLVAIMQIAIVFASLSWLTPFNMNTFIESSTDGFFDSGLNEENLVSYQLISQYSDNEMAVTMFEPFHNINNWLWILFIITIIFLIFQSRPFTLIHVKSRLLLIAIYSFTFSTLGTLMSYGASTKLVQMSLDNTNSSMYRYETIIGFTPFITFITLFSFVFIITLIGSYILKIFYDKSGWDINKMTMTETEQFLS